MSKSDRQADRVQAPAAHVGGQSEAPRSVKVHPVHTGEVVTGDRSGRGPVPRSLRLYGTVRLMRPDEPLADPVGADLEPGDLYGPED